MGSRRRETPDFNMWGVLPCVSEYRRSVCQIKNVRGCIASEEVEIIQRSCGFSYAEYVQSATHGCCVVSTVHSITKCNYLYYAVFVMFDPTSGAFDANPSEALSLENFRPRAPTFVSACGIYGDMLTSLLSCFLCHDKAPPWQMSVRVSLTYQFVMTVMSGRLLS